MWKIIMALIREKIYNLLINLGLFREEKKGYHKEQEGEIY